MRISLLCGAALAAVSLASPSARAGFDGCCIAAPTFPLGVFAWPAPVAVPAVAYVTEPIVPYYVVDQGGPIIFPATYGAPWDAGYILPAPVPYPNPYVRGPFGPYGYPYYGYPYIVSHNEGRHHGYRAYPVASTTRHDGLFARSRGLPPGTTSRPGAHIVRLAPTN
jgi:hypothetical protein